MARPKKTLLSIRIPEDLHKKFLAEADRHGFTPGAFFLFLMHKQGFADDMLQQLNAPAPVVNAPKPPKTPKPSIEEEFTF